MLTVRPRSRLFTAFLSSAIVAAGVTASSAAYATGTPATGVLEVCKKASGSGVNGAFTFTVSGVAGAISVPVNGCSNPITVTAGNVVITETARAGFVLADVVTTPTTNLVSKDLNARTATVKVVAGGVAKQTIATFTNKKAPTGFLEVCKKAPAGDALTGAYTFTVATSGTTTTVTAPVGGCANAIELPAGEATVTETARAGAELTAIAVTPTDRSVSTSVPNRSATVKIVEGALGSQTIVTFTNKTVPPPKGVVKVCKIAGSGIAAGQTFAFTVGGVSTTAQAGSCSLPLTVTVGNVTVVETGTTGYDVTAITVAGAGSLVSSNLSTATAVVSVSTGVTEVNFTNKSKNRAPSCVNVKASPNSIWPPNHKFKTVTLSGATDPDGDATTLTITGVTQDESLNGTGDGDTSPDAATVAGRTDQVQVRAERSGNGDGRVYRISFTVSDGKLSCSGTAYVGVPHDQSGDPAVDTTSVTVNSFG